MSQQGNTSLLLLGSLGLGAGLMYLLDPERGQQRRRQGLATAALYRDRAEEALEHVTRGLSRRTSGAGRQARHLINEAQRQLRQAPWSAAPARTPARQTSLLPTLSWLGGVVLGAGLMYLFDPLGGPQRRQVGLRKAQSYWKKTNVALDKTTREPGRHARERLSDGQKRQAQTDTSSPRSTSASA
jgi:hypothetical protein